MVEFRHLRDNWRTDMHVKHHLKDRGNAAANKPVSSTDPGGVSVVAVQYVASMSWPFSNFTDPSHFMEAIENTSWSYLKGGDGRFYRCYGYVNVIE